MRSSLIVLLALALLAVLGGLLFKFVPAVKAFTPIAQAIQHVPQLNALNGYVPLIAAGGATGTTLVGLALDFLAPRTKNDEDKEVRRSVKVLRNEIKRM